MPAYKRRDINKALKNTENATKGNIDRYMTIGIYIKKDDDIYKSLEKCMQYRKMTSCGKYAKIALLRLIESDIQEIEKHTQTENAENTDTQ